jgi:hypothetical protein
MVHSAAPMVMAARLLSKLLFRNLYAFSLSAPEYFNWVASRPKKGSEATSKSRGPF